jgi:hypothetical protein
MQKEREAGKLETPRAEFSPATGLQLSVKEAIFLGENIGIKAHPTRLDFCFGFLIYPSARNRLLQWLKLQWTPPNPGRIFPGS